MFFPEKIKNIKPGDKVLEIGPGSLPFSRSDVYLDKVFTGAEASAQRGYAKEISYNKPLYTYDGTAFPFKDNEFDYVICSHVLEHVPENELPSFFTEIQRVAKKGYVEFPTIFYELINYQDVHLWLMNYKNGTVYFLDKNIFSSGPVHKIYREMFYSRGGDLQKLFTQYKELFFSAFEWEGNLTWKKVNNIDELVDENDYNTFKRYFALQKPQINRNNQGNMMSILKKLVKRLFASAGLVNSSIHKTAILENKDLIHIAKNAEIKEHVIIKSYDNPVKVGSFSQINAFTVIYGGSGVTIGENVMIAPHCMIAGGNHNYKQTEKPMRFAESISKGPIDIQDNVWIGANCTITDGVTIGNDALIAANSLVNINVAPYDIVSGVPAQVVGNRKKLFSKEG